MECRYYYLLFILKSSGTKIAEHTDFDRPTIYPLHMMPKLVLLPLGVVLLEAGQTFALVVMEKLKHVFPPFFFYNFRAVVFLES